MSESVGREGEVAFERWLKEGIFSRNGGGRCGLMCAFWGEGGGRKGGDAKV